MKLARSILDFMSGQFEKGGRLHRLYPLYEAIDTFTFTPGTVTSGRTHVRDSMDLKRLMMTVVIALVPAILVALYNTGYQANLAIERLVGSGGGDVTGFALDNWRTSLYMALGLQFSSSSISGCMVHGFLYYFPVLIVTFLVGGFWEVLFSAVRRHEINEGFLVTGMLFPMILPPAIPLWQVALGISFGVVIGKEVFGGVGKNIFNPALVGRAFLFFAYPSAISGDSVWIAVRGLTVDGVSGATALTLATGQGMSAVAVGGYSWWHSFIGLIPGSMGETSTLACLIGAFILIVTRVASWRSMFGVVLGTAALSGLLNVIGSDTNPGFQIPFWWHIVLGGWAFGTVFMVTDPVSSAFTGKGQLIYGFLIGAMVVLIRVINPAYPEGMMLAILFMNMFAPLIDYFIVKANIKRRARHAKG
jgi:Na+-transporting NADH:ubiquinone oxidoreductase subunit B